MCFQTWEGLWNFSKTSSSQHYPYSLPFFQNYYKRPFYSPYFYHLPRLIIFLFPIKVVEISIFKIWKWKSCPKESSKWSEFTVFKRRKWKELKEDPNSVGNGRFHCLVALGRLHCLVTLGRLHYLMALGRLHCLVALGRFHCLVPNGRRKRNTFSHFPTFPPIKFI